MTLIFSVQNGVALAGTLNYLAAEHSLQFDVQSRAHLLERVGSGGVTSVVLETLQLEVAVESGEALFVWGYFPMQSWHPASLTPPHSLPGRVFVTPSDSMESGTSIPIEGSSWRVEFDTSIGWLALRAKCDAAARFIQIADGVVLGIDDTRLISIWLKPEFSV